ncbi:MAG: phosphatase PAP2 family protein [Euryarchaeota archaeon]|jgi:undecaprenyl-diphosphatase|uniref:phosphatase PAP2 family protein n=1 Tax=Methanobacterium sp. MZD130B TaxID=3394378 RepID=UPI0039FBA39A|nr:phosphatase PAP2 family protein [Euryarchaeota archaeon]
MDLTTQTSEMKLFEFGSQKKLILILLAAILLVSALITYFIPGFNYHLVASFNALRTNASFAWFWYNFTSYMLYIVLFPIIVVYIMSFKVNKLKPYRLVLFLSILVTGIGTPIVDPVMKDLFAIPRPWVAYSDINSLYHVTGFSFPSGHSFESFAVTLPLMICFLSNDENFRRNWKKVVLSSLLLIFAITLSFSRVLVGVHYISDVFAGIGFAILLTVLLSILLQWFLDTNRLNLQNEKWYALLLIFILVINTFFIR